MALVRVARHTGTQQWALEMCDHTIHMTFKYHYNRLFFFLLSFNSYSLSLNIYFIRRLISQLVSKYPWCTDHTHADMDAHTHARTRTHAHTHMHACTHTHTQALSLLSCCSKYGELTLCGRQDVDTQTCSEYVIVRLIVSRRKFSFNLILWRWVPQNGFRVWSGQDKSSAPGINNLFNLSSFLTVYLLFKCHFVAW